MSFFKRVTSLSYKFHDHLQQSKTIIFTFLYSVLRAATKVRFISFLSYFAFFASAAPYDELLLISDIPIVLYIKKKTAAGKKGVLYFSLRKACFLYLNVYENKMYSHKTMIPTPIEKYIVEPDKKSLTR